MPREDRKESKPLRGVVQSDIHQSLDGDTEGLTLGVAKMLTFYFKESASQIGHELVRGNVLTLFFFGY